MTREPPPAAVSDGRTCEIPYYDFPIDGAEDGTSEDLPQIPGGHPQAGTGFLGAQSRTASPGRSLRRPDRARSGARDRRDARIPRRHGRLLRAGAGSRYPRPLTMGRLHLVDSSGWLEYFTDGPSAARFAEPLSDPDRLVVPTIGLHEVFRVVLRERGEDDAIRAVALMRGRGKFRCPRPSRSKRPVSRMSGVWRWPMPSSSLLPAASERSSGPWMPISKVSRECVISGRRRPEWRRPRRRGGLPSSTALFRNPLVDDDVHALPDAGAGRQGR